MSTVIKIIQTVAYVFSLMVSIIKSIGTKGLRLPGAAAENPALKSEDISKLLK